MTSGHLVAGRYRLDRRIGAGAMGQVWAATDERLRRQVAVKLVDVTLASDPTVAERFQREAYATAQLSHPTIVTIFDAGTDGTTAYLVMELLPGESVADVVRTRGPLPVAEARRIAAEVARALEATHAIGVVHRDIKPANVMLAGNSVKLLDFGIAQISADAAHATLTAPASTVGTAAYMSPEQAQGLRAGPASDIYSLGCLLMTMLTGRPPFTGPNSFQVAHAQIAETPPRVSARRPEVPWELDDLVRRMLAKDPAQRPGAAAVRARLQAAPAGGGYRPPVVAGDDAPTRVTGPAATRVAPPAPASTAVLPPDGVPSATRSPVGPGDARPAPPAPDGDRWFRRGVRRVVLAVAVLLVLLVAWTLLGKLAARVSAHTTPEPTARPTTPAATSSPRPLPTFEPPPLPTIPLPTIPVPSLPSLPTLPSAGEVARRAAVEGVSVALGQVADDGVRRELQASWRALTPALLAGRDVDARLAAFTDDVDAARGGGLTVPEYLAIRLALNAVGAAV